MKMHCCYWICLLFFFASHAKTDYVSIEVDIDQHCQKMMGNMESTLLLKISDNPFIIHELAGTADIESKVRDEEESTIENKSKNNDFLQSGSFLRIG